MVNKESEIWERLNKANKANPLEPAWLNNSYSPNFCVELREAIAIQIGMLSVDAWSILHPLINKYGPQPELINAAGICHQLEAKDWLLRQIQGPKGFNLDVLKALACWGAILSKEILQQILEDSSQEIRIAGIELLKFKSYQLNEKELLNLTNTMLNNECENIVVEIIKILQRREGIIVINCLSRLAIKGPSKVTYHALMALGSIETKESRMVISKLIKDLPETNNRNLAIKQLRSQYRLLEVNQHHQS